MTKYVALFLLFAIVALSGVVMAEDWAPIPQADLDSKQAAVEPDADAEALFWEIRAEDRPYGRYFTTIYDSYIRIKIYSDRGREKYGTVDLTYGSGTKLKDIEARTIKPDGTIVALDKDTIFDREVVKGKSLKVKAKSFALPGIEPGCIIEYRWREEVSSLHFYKRLHCQRNIPVRRATFHVKPGPGIPLGMGMYYHGVQPSPIEKEGDGWVTTSVTNVPAIKEEPYMPPEDEVRGWVLFYYGEDFRKKPADYWKELGKRIWDNAKWVLRQDDNVREKAAELVAGATSDEEKLKRLYDFCRTEIKNSDDDATFTREQREKLKESWSPSETLKRKVGTGQEISTLFGALVRAIGMDARYARLPDRGDVFFDISLLDDYFFTRWDIAVKVGDKWRFFDPGSTYVEYGMLPWQQEGVHAFITDPKAPFFQVTEHSPYARTYEKRTANLKLTEDGAIEGDVVFECGGHRGVISKEFYDDMSQTAAEEAIKQIVRQNVKAAELSQITYENISAPDKPFVYKFHIRIPDYAQKTGKRLFLQPAFFQKGVQPPFSASERTHMVYFNYAWKEEDDVTIELPEGYTLEAAESPGPLAAGDIIEYEVKANREGNKLKLRRKFSISRFMFAKENYPTLKAIFDDCHKRDNTAMTLKQTATAQEPASE